ALRLLAIKHMVPQLVSLRNGRMLEVTRRLMDKAETIHQFSGRSIHRRSEGDNFRQLQDAESVIESLKSPAIRKASSPIFAAKSPAHFHAGHERRLETGNGQSNERSEVAVHIQCP